MRKARFAALLAALAAFTAASASAQVSSSLQSINLNAVKGQSLTLSAPSPGTQSLNIVDNAMNQYTTPFAVTVAWNVDNSTTTTVKLVGYFATPEQALANGSSYIASSKIETSVDAGTTWVPATAAAVGGVGTTGGSVLLYTSPVTQGSNKLGSHAATFLVRINLVGAANTTSGTYSGTLNLIAICN